MDQCPNQDTESCGVCSSVKLRHPPMGVKMGANRGV